MLLVRTASRNVVVGGKQLRAGDRVLLLVAAAKRDPKEFGPADKVAIEREQIRHLRSDEDRTTASACIARRLELWVAPEELLARLEGVCIDENHIKYDSGCSLGPMHLNIELTPNPHGVERTVRSGCPSSAVTSSDQPERALEVACPL